MAWGVAPEAQRPVLGAGASTSGDPGLPPEEAAVRLLRDLLAAFFQAYLEDASEVRKPQMSLLLAQAHQHGLVGARAPRARRAARRAPAGARCGPEKFAAFYHFVDGVARERGDRNLRRRGGDKRVGVRARERAVHTARAFLRVRQKPEFAERRLRGHVVPCDSPTPLFAASPEDASSPPRRRGARAACWWTSS